ncbi:MAG: septal ring lytic transglycosylase RlpA family protein [Bryobacteraceae bacterium]
MLFRNRLAALAFSCAIVLGLCGCARKKHVTSGVPPTPQVSRTPQVLPQGPETGIASWYGHPYHGRPAADGEIYDMEKLTAAHRTLPFNTWVRVTNLTNGKTVEVRIIDRGPFIDGRIIDLSHAAAQAIDLIGPGIAQVRLDIISAPPQPPSTPTLFAIQIGAFEDRGHADRVCNAMEEQFGTARVIFRQGPPSVWRVLVGAVSSLDDANVLADHVRTQTGEALVVRLE